MRYETISRPVGEQLGPIDWGFPFEDEAPGWCASGNQIQENIRRALRRLSELEDGYRRGERWEYYTGNVWSPVRWVGMYDGWPFWEPYPRFAVEDWSGAWDWRCWYDLATHSIRRCKP